MYIYIYRYVYIYIYVCVCVCVCVDPDVANYKPFVVPRASFSTGDAHTVCISRCGHLYTPSLFPLPLSTGDARVLWANGYLWTVHL